MKYSMALADLTSKVRSRLIIKAYRSWLRPKSRVLDVGCGNGIVSEILSRHFNLNLTGCDNLSYLSRPIKFTLMTNQDQLPFMNKQFDTVMFNDVLHHVEYKNQEKLLTEALRVGKEVLMFELKPTLAGILSDWLINKIHNWHMPIPFTYRHPDDWKRLFKKLKTKPKVIQVNKPLFYPFSHIVYHLNGRMTK